MLLAGGVAAAADMGGCATRPPPRTIEPPEAAATTGVQAGLGAGSGAGSGVGSGAGAGAGEDAAFVLSRAARVGGGAPATTAQAPLHVGDQWWAFRGSFLQLDEAEVRGRDEAVSDKQAPVGFWDAQTSVETVSLWTTLCNECHGGRRRLTDAVTMPPPGPGWGRGDGLFFGSRRPYVEIFNKIFNGGSPREDKRPRMPAWRGKLAREQIWALIYFLEYQSGGIEGRFPPSLYPRSQTED